jgi:hypothetical protein
LGVGRGFGDGERAIYPPLHRACEQ